MPKITSGKIIWLPEDRTIFSEVSPGITPAQFKSLFENSLTNGDVTQYYKFLEEITEKDPDIQTAIATRSAEITSKEWTVEGENAATAEELLDALLSIPGEPSEGLLTVDQLISAFLGSAYLTGISVNEIVADSEQIIGFNHVPAHFLTFQDAVNYPKLWTKTNPMGVDFNKEKMIVHYLKPGIDVARGWLGHALGWQYVLKLQSFEQSVKWQRRYGKGFLLVNMPGDRDSYDKAWSVAEQLVDNLDTVDGAVFPNGVTAEMVASTAQEGQFFFDVLDDYKNNITKIILGQNSTTESESSNRSTAAIHMEVLETRVLEDMQLIENTLTKGLLKKIQVLKGMNPDEEYRFRFVVSDLEEDIADKEASEEMNGTETKEEIV